MSVFPLKEYPYQFNTKARDSMISLGQAAFLDVLGEPEHGVGEVRARLEADEFPVHVRLEHSARRFRDAVVEE